MERGFEIAVLNQTAILWNKIETDTVLIDEFIFILNADWMGRNNWMSILLKQNKIKDLLKENRIPKIVNVPVPPDHVFHTNIIAHCQ